MLVCFIYFSFFFFNDTATTEIYTLSLHDALPIYAARMVWAVHLLIEREVLFDNARAPRQRRHGGNDSDRDRKSTRLNSSHSQISYAVFCLKKKNIKKNTPSHTNTL